MNTEKNLMQNEKQMITTELLGLRAGLSVISQYTDEIRKEEEKIREKTQFYDKNCREEEEKVSELATRLEQEKRHCAELKRQKENWEDRWRNPRKYDYNSADIKFWGESDSGFWFFLLIFGLGTMGGFFVLHAIIYACRKAASKKKVVEEATQKHAEVCRQIEKTQQYVSRLEKQFEQMRVKKEENIAVFEKQKEEAILPHQQIIEALAERAQIVNAALQETYGMFLSEADWQNIDLVVHYVQTGRADTLKEALYQVDRQRQNDRIVHAIREAKEAICSHIESAFSRMGQALTLCFEKLDMRIQGLSAQMLETRKATLATNNAMLERLDTQISATQANTALLEKANASSDELICDLRYNQKYWVK